MPKVGRLVKESSVRDIAGGISERPNFLVTSINRLPASEADRLRQALSGVQGRMIVVKRRLGRRAIEGLKLPGVGDNLFALLEGTVGLVLPKDDLLPVAKALVEFIKAHEDQLTVRGGLFDGQVLDKHRVEELASLPSKAVLLAQVLGTIEAPIAQLIATVEQLISDLIYGIDELAKKKPLPAAPSQVESSAAQAGLPATQAQGQAAAPADAKTEPAPEGPPTASEPPQGGQTPESEPKQEGTS